jgi:hypothetical protein
MNERIKELEKQCWSHRVNGRLVDGQLHFDTQKFAELIVRECAGKVDWILAEGGKTQGDLIREHFGVEE